MDMDVPFGLPPSFVLGILAGLIGYFVAYLISTAMSDVLYPNLKKETNNEKDEKSKILIHSYFTSLVHAIVQTEASIYPALQSNDHWHNRVLHFDEKLYVDYGLTGIGPSFWSGVFVGYLFADLLAVGKHENVLMVCHHVFACSMWTYCTLNRQMQWYQSFLQCNELSTIFLSTRYILTVGLGCNKSSSIVLLFNLLCFICFGCIRIFPLPSIAYHFWNNDMNTLKEKNGVNPHAIGCMFLFHMCMQCFWYFLMVKLVVNVLCGRGKKIEKVDGKDH
jgi:hypothetical protein